MRHAMVYEDVRSCGRVGGGLVSSGEEVRFEFGGWRLLEKMKEEE